MMADDAITRAELWSRSLGHGAAIEAALAGSTPEALAGTLRLANIDRVLLIPEKGDPIPVYGPDDSAQLEACGRRARRCRASPPAGGERCLYTRPSQLDPARAIP